MKRLAIFFIFPVCALFAQTGPQDIPTTLPDVMRPKSTKEVPTELRETNYFGKVKDPRLEAYDPYRSTFFIEGRDPSLDQFEGGKVLDDLSHRLVVRYGSLPTVAVTFGRPVSILMMRNGKIILPKRFEIIPPPEDMVQVITAKNSPYIYFQANEGAIYPDSNYPFTHVFVLMELEGRPIQFQIRLKVVPPRSEELLPLVILDMIGDLPEVLTDGNDQRAGVQEAPRAVGPTNAVNQAAAVSAIASVQPQQAATGNPYYFSGTGPMPVLSPMARADVRDLFPTMIEMAKLYEQAVYDRAPGYGKEQIVRFRPASVRDGQVVAGGIPAFRNPNDGQLYYVPWGYYFPEYDAMVYEMIFHNSSSEDLWFDYSLMRVLFGFEQVYDKGPRGPKNVTAVSPENFEKTPAGQYNTFWILVQGKGINPTSTPVRFLFPPSGLGATVPVVTGNPAPSNPTTLNYQEGAAFMFESSNK